MVPINLVKTIEFAGFDYGMSSRDVAEGVVTLYHCRTREVVVLNATGAHLWQACSGGTSCEDLEAELRATFEVGDADITREVRDFLDELVDAGLLATHSAGDG